MNNKYLIIVILVLFLIISSYSVRADFVLETGISTNILFMSDFNDFLAYRNWDLNRVFGRDYTNDFNSLNHGFAYTLTGEYWFDDLFALNTELELFHPLEREYIYGARNYNERTTNNLVGILPGVSLQLFSDEQLEINLTGALGKYYHYLEWSREFDFDVSGVDKETRDIKYYESYSYQAESLGAKFGTKISYQIIDGIMFEGRFNYRMLEFDELINSKGQRLFNTYTGEPLVLDYSGFELRSTVSILF